MIENRFSFKRIFTITKPIRNLGFLLLVFCFFSPFSACNSENANDCFQRAGATIRETVELPDFTRVFIFEGVQLVLKQGDTQLVELETGENLRNDIIFGTNGSQLRIKNENRCNFFRDYELTTVFITSPNITEVRSSSGFLVSSDGALEYPDLALISESFNEPENETTDGTFDIEVNNNRLQIVVNGVAYFKLRGTTNIFNFTIAAGDSRIEAQELQAQEVSLNHRGSNDAFISPLQSVSGVIRGYGDVISETRPPNVEVEELFDGRLIFKD